MMKFYITAFLTLLCAFAQADVVLTDAEMNKVLERISRAARESTYQGVYIQQRSGATESYRLFHALDAGVELERRESMDGSSREMVRKGDVVSLYLPEKLRLAAGSRGVTELMYPQLAASAIAPIIARYQLKRQANERLAGMDTEVYILEPRDKLRYSKKVWVHTGSGLLVKVALLGKRRELQEVFSFSQLQLGAIADRKLLQASSTLLPVNVQIRKEFPQAVSEPGWAIRDLPAGYRLIRQFRRILADQDKPAVHHLYSDGLCSVSVFLEPAHPGLPQGFAHQGMTYVYGLDLQGQHVTVLGEAPPETIEQFGKAYQPVMSHDVDKK